MKRFRGIIWVVIIIAALVLFKIFFLKSDTDASSFANKKNSATAVNALIVKPQLLNNVALVSGSLQANESVDLQPQLNGQITELNFKEGDFVRKGALLVRINDATLQALLKKQKAALDVAQNNWTRITKLYQLNAVNEDDYNNAKLAVESAQADIDYTSAEIDNTQILAPFDGVIGVRNVSLGAFVTPSTVIATLYQSNPMKVDFEVPEKIAPLVKEGTPIVFTMQANGKRYHAKVYMVNPAINADTRTLTVRALCENDGSLRPGSFANINVDLGSDSAALMVPTQSIIPILNGQQLYVFHRDTVFNIPVQIGIRNDTAVEVINGLNAGDTVITSGILFLRPKMKVVLGNVR